MGADIVDVNMGCPVAKIAKHHAGCSLMREPAHAAAVIAAMAKAVQIPVTVKMRAGWNDAERNAPTLARMVEDAGASRDRSARPHSCSELQRDRRTGIWWHGSPAELTSRCSAAATASSPNRSSSGWRSGVEGVLVGRGALRNPWILAQASDLAAGRTLRVVDAGGSWTIPARLHRAADDRARSRTGGVSPLADQERDARPGDG